ncbi:MAG: branched-chain amino acid ABC transporter permease, partial [Microbacterium sp. 14-71-5]
MSTSSDGPRPLPTAEAAREVIETESVATQRRGPFRGLRERWNGLSRPAQWGWMLIVVAIAYAMPYLNFFPLSTAPGNDWPLALFAMAVYALVAVGLNVVVGYAGLLDLGYVAFFAVGSYTAAMFTSPDSPY